MDVRIYADGDMVGLSLRGKVHSLQDDGRDKRAVDSLLHPQTPPLCCHRSLYRSFYLLVGSVQGHKGFSVRGTSIPYYTIKKKEYEYAQYTAHIGGIPEF